VADFQIFGLRSTGDDVLVNVEHISSVGGVYVQDEPDFQVTLRMIDGSKIDLCDFWRPVVERLTGATREGVSG